MAKKVDGLKEEYSTIIEQFSGEPGQTSETPLIKHSSTPSSNLLKNRNQMLTTLHKKLEQRVALIDGISIRNDLHEELDTINQLLSVIDKIHVVKCI